MSELKQNCNELEQRLQYNLESSLKTEEESEKKVTGIYTMLNSVNTLGAAALRKNYKSLWWAGGCDGEL